MASVRARSVRRRRASRLLRRCAEPILRSSAEANSTVLSRNWKPASRSVPLTNNFAAAASLRGCVAADNRQRSGGAKAIAKGGTDFKGVGPRLASSTAHADAIVAKVFHGQSEKRNRNVGAEIIRRVADFVKSCSLTVGSCDATARAARLGDDAASVIRYFDDWKADVRGRRACRASRC